VAAEVQAHLNLSNKTTHQPIHRQTQTETETEEVIQANFGEVKFGEAKFE
tara:strand:- start:386 stop:535 length:150 start_codon:yes stop_codon:yes gene_type:complete